LLGVGACNGSPPPSATNGLPTLQDWVNDLRSPNESTRLMAATALGEMGPEAKSALPALASTIDDPSPKVRMSVVWSLVHVDPTGKEVLVYLYSAMKDDDVGVRVYAVKAVGKLRAGGAQAAPELERLLKDPAPRVRKATAEAFAAIGPAANNSRPYLVDVSNHDPDASVREAAARAVEALEDI
jgi:HEAT repeat protein